MKIFSINGRKNSLEEDFMLMIQENKENFYRIAYSYVKNEQDALDVIQDSVCKGYVALEKVKEKKYLKTWFTKIVINTAIDTLKRNKKVIAIPDTDHLDGSYENKGIESKLDLYEALDVLRHQERAIIVLRYFEDRKLDEIAEVMALPLNTVKTILYRGLKKLKNHLGEGKSNGK